MFMSQNLVDKTVAQALGKEEQLVSLVAHDKGNKAEFQACLIAEEEESIIGIPCHLLPIHNHFQDSDLHFPFLQWFRLTDPLRKKGSLEGLFWDN